MRHDYTDERNAQIIISLMKAHNIRKVIASPGTTNICLIASIQNDPFFEIYSAADERSAGYIACGLSAESGEPVAISCTGATASRNYMPALTEAYYRKLPILAITSSRRSSRIGHNMDQVTDRTLLPKDVAKMSVQMPLVYDKESEWACIIAANKAMLELTHRGNGPVHINLETNYSKNYDVKELPETRAIYRVTNKDKMPEIEAGKIAIMVGAHKEWSSKLTESVNEFCRKYNAVVLCDHICNYKGEYGVFMNLLARQSNYRSVVKDVDLMIHIGDVTASNYDITTKSVWRVNPDGELRDTYGKLKYVFEMEEEEFFSKYALAKKTVQKNTLIEKCEEEIRDLYEQLGSKIEKLPFSNAWIASQTAHRLPENAVLHLGIQNSLRFWNYFMTPKSVLGYSNTGGFGIDGSLSSTIGAALADKNKVYYCVLGDLAFFYDMNSLGNKHLPSNIRIILINNGKGAEFKLSGNPGHMFGEDTDVYISAAGHYGNKSPNLVKHYAEDLGFKYYAVNNKDEYPEILDEIVKPNFFKEPIIVEVFTHSEDEDMALTLLSEVKSETKQAVKNNTKKVIKKLIGEKTANKLKRMLDK